MYLCSFIGVFVLLFSNNILAAQEPSHVLIDTNMQYVTFFASVPGNFPSGKLSQLKEKIKGKKDVVLINWTEFKGNLKQYLQSYIIRNDYMEIDIVKGFQSLLEKYPGTPFALTWNGGIGVTGNDFRYALKTYEMYLKDKKRIVRNSDRNRDPVHPENHLQPLLQQ